MSFVLIFRPEVREELDEAYHWYEEQQEGLGDDFLDRVIVLAILHGRTNPKKWQSRN